VKIHIYAHAQVSAVNSVKEGIPSSTVVNRTIVTVPGPPPAPLMNGASRQSLRVSWAEPTDTGAAPRLQLPMVSFQLVMEPRRDLSPGNETMIFTTARQIVLTGMQPNTQYRFIVSARNAYFEAYGVPSETLFAATTPNAPRNLRLASVISNMTTGIVTVQWDWQGVQQGPLQITGYRISSRRDGREEVALTLCTGGDNLMCRLEGFLRGVTYIITVAAANDPRLETSFGPESAPLVITTPASLPTMSIERFTGTTANATTIHWYTETGGLPMLGYLVRVQRESEGFDNGTMVPGPASHTVTGLGPNLVYTFIVRGYNAAGYRESTHSQGETSFVETCTTSSSSQ
jgi:hypothetical protein